GAHPQPQEMPAAGDGAALDGKRSEPDLSAAQDGAQAQRDAPVGGQAVLEGVMMRGVSNWAVAVRKPPAQEQGDGSPSDRTALGDIEVSAYPLRSALRRHRALRLPIIRGVVALGGSLAIGFRALEVSANAQLPQEEDGEKPQEISGGVWAGTLVVAL